MYSHIMFKRSFSIAETSLDFVHQKQLPTISEHSNGVALMLVQAP